jgi:UDP-galactopyranose mutase
MSAERSQLSCCFTEKFVYGDGVNNNFVLYPSSISSIERVEEFKYLGTTLTNQNSIQAEIKTILKLGNACYYSVQNLLSSRFLSKNLKI